MSTAEQIVLWLWRYRDALTNHWKRLSWYVTEAEAENRARRNGTELRRIEGREDRRVAVTNHSNLPSRARG